LNSQNFGKEIKKIREVMGSREGGNLKRVFYCIERNEEISMKKTLVTCLAVVALFAIASSAVAITCTVDKRPAATLLVPYFAASFNADGSVDGTGIDTIVTIANASDAPMVAHVNVFNKRSELVLDFNIALTGFDVQSMRMSGIISGHLPTTGETDAKGNLIDACQRNGAAGVNPFFFEFLRFCGAGPCNVTLQLPFQASGFDNKQATTLYAPGGAFSFADGFGKQVLDSLDQTSDTNLCGGVDGVVTGPAEGYITIDAVNYCTVSDPTDPNYYIRQALSFENNLWGDVIFETGTGVGTFAGSLVHVEADTTAGLGTEQSFASATNLAQDFHTDANSCPNTPCVPNVRTFYARYVTPAAIGSRPNPGINANAPWNSGGWGDQREPLGLRYGVRWSNDTANGITSNFSVWRASANQLTDLLNSFETTGKSGGCKDIEPVVSLTFWDEDENTVLTGPCPSPCSSTTFNFPFETQRTNIGAFAGALPAATFGWAQFSFFNNTGFSSVDNFLGTFDQAYALYDMEGAAAFLSFQENAAQLDPTNCNPLGIPKPPPGFEDGDIWPKLVIPHPPGDTDFFEEYGWGGDSHIVGTGKN
jgi:hypothetical protein